MAGTKIGPLTSVFSAPSSCSNTDVYLIWNVGQTADVFDGYAQEPFRTECFPEGYKPIASLYYSPASECPSGYTIACETTNVAGDVTDTIRTCCPK